LPTTICSYKLTGSFVRWLKILGLLLLFIVGAVSLLARWVAPHVPSDQKLVKEFYKKRPDLERLVSMLADDSRMTHIAPDFLWTEDNVAWPRPDISIRAVWRPPEALSNGSEMVADGFFCDRGEVVGLAGVEPAT
jgi:hypothetical protein